jgi:HEAT repeat protein
MKKLSFTMLCVLFMSLAAMGADKTEKEYIADLDGAKDEQTIVTAADWLGKEKKSGAVPGLVLLLKDGRDKVRLSAVMALGYIGEEGPAEDVAAVMLDDSNAHVRYAAILSTMRIGSKKSLKALVEAREKETDPYNKDLLVKLEEKSKKK